MKLKYFSSCLALGALAFLATACNDAEYTEIDNGLYIAEASPMNAFNQQIEMQLVDDSNIERKYTVRMARPVGEDVTVKLEFDESMITAYNAKHATDYQMLPQQFLEMNTMEAVIPAGETAAASLLLTIKPYTTPNQEQYAVPVKIASVSGPIAVTGRGDRLLLLLTMPNKQKSVVLKSPHQTVTTFKGNYALNEWTFEYWLKVNNKTNNPTEPWYGAGDGVKDHDKNIWKRRMIFSDGAAPIYLGGTETMLLRYWADGAKCYAPTLQCQLDGAYFDSEEFWYPDTWFHITYTYDGSKMILYKDGVKNKELEVSKKFTFKQLVLADNMAGTMEIELAQIRLWNKCLPPSSITEGMSRQLPDGTDGLVGYWPCDEGEGTVLKDHSGKGNDIDFGAKTPNWSETVYNFAHPNGK